MKSILVLPIAVALAFADVASAEILANGPTLEKPVKAEQEENGPATRPLRDAEALFDRDRDGSLNATEQAAYDKAVAKRAKRIEKKMAPYDLDGDGKLSKEEREQMGKRLTLEKAKRKAEDLKVYDLDGDGRLSAEEREARAKDREAKRKGKQEDSAATD